MLRKFLVYVDDGINVFKVAVPAKNEKAVREFIKGNGEIIAIKDVSESYPIDGEKVIEALQTADFGEMEMDFIVRALHFVGITD